MEFNILLRELTPFEHLVCEHLCEGMTNSAIAKTTSHTEKVVENTVSRAAHAFSIKSTAEINVRGLAGVRAAPSHYLIGPDQYQVGFVQVE